MTYSSKPCGNYGPPILNRRDMLQRAGQGFGLAALASLIGEDQARAATSGAVGTVKPNTKAKAKSVIMLFMGGGPSQVDTWDPKQELAKLHGQDVPESIAETVPRIARSPLHNLFASPFKFQKYGNCGMECSELFHHTAGRADDICLIRSMKHNSPIHAPAEYISLTGSGVGNRPSLGAWVTYGLGSINRNLPSFVVFTSDGTGRPPGWSSGFLPARHQGTVVNSSGVPNLEMPAGYTLEKRQHQLDLLSDLNEQHLARHGGNSELEARIRAYELAFGMQMSAPEAFDLSQETADTKKLYGLERDTSREFGTHCLLARRLVERGVRFIQLRNGNWDAHGKLAENHKARAASTDQPIAAMLTDLKRRGLLDETLVVWTAEFGRTPTAQGNGEGAGRDHSPSAYCTWLAGGGVRGGQIIGQSDPVGYAAIERPVSPNNLHATLLHALGIDQHDLFFEFHNRRELPTVTATEMIPEVFG